MVRLLEQHKVKVINKEFKVNTQIKLYNKSIKVVGQTYKNKEEQHGK